jgi:alanine transaminase
LFAQKLQSAGWRRFVSNDPKRGTEFIFSKLTDTTKASPLIAKLQQECWDGYVATGRGCHTLFQLLDTDSSGAISWQEVRFFLENVRESDINPDARREVLESASEGVITFPKFQKWLIKATKVDQGLKNTFAMENYQASIGKAPSPEESHHSWNKHTMSQNLRRMQYAVRGEVVIRADALAAEGKKIIYTNIGNPHAVGQKPITYYRQVSALCNLPSEYGVENSAIASTFPADVVERAIEMRKAVGKAGTGAYTNSQGIMDFRKDVANFITMRDEHACIPSNIFLSNGASAAIESVLTALIGNNRDAIMIPIPQYPIYSAIISRLGARQCGYFLDEESGWAITERELELRRTAAVERDGLDIRALTIINPGNPTGQVLSRDDLEVICKFCAKYDIVLLADEVYQRNIYDENKKFVSAKKVAIETPGCENLQLISFHSTSKGFIGECGRRGGYMELHNIDPYVHTQLYKLASSGLCSSIDGQLMTSLMVRPPMPGEDSFDLFTNEEFSIFDSLKRRANSLVKGLNEIDGMSCNPSEGAMYAFPRVQLPPKAIDEAKKQDMTPDTMYALSLLEETGICVVPASGFGQKSGRFGFRTTFLPPEDELDRAIVEFKRHHEMFHEKHS